MRISDWSSDVCSSDLGGLTVAADGLGVAGGASVAGGVTVTDVGLTVTAGGVVVTGAGLAVADGVVVSSGGADVTGGARVAVGVTEVGTARCRESEGHDVQSLVGYVSLKQIVMKKPKDEHM